jgi:hypothetical protein
VVLCDAPDGRGASWGDDGNIIAALKPADALSRVPSGGGMVQLVTELKPEKKDLTHRWPQVLPGAQAVLFTAHTVTGDYDRATVEVQSLRTGERKTLVRVGYFGALRAKIGAVLAGVAIVIAQRRSPPTFFQVLVRALVLGTTAACGAA